MQIDTHIIDFFIDIIDTDDDDDKLHDFCPGTMLVQDSRVSQWLTKKRKLRVLTVLHERKAFSVA